MRTGSLLLQRAAMAWGETGAAMLHTDDASVQTHAAATSATTGIAAMVMSHL